MRLHAADEIQRLAGEVDLLHDEAGALRDETQTLRGEVDTLRRQPLTRATPIQYPALGLPRDFAANEALRESALGASNGAAGREERRAHLTTQRQNLMAEAEKETDAVQRMATVQRLLAVEWELGQIGG